MSQNEEISPEVQQMLEEMKFGLKALRQQVGECIQNQTAQRELYQQERDQLQVQVYKLLHQSVATEVNMYIMQDLATSFRLIVLVA